MTGDGSDVGAGRGPDHSIEDRLLDIAVYAPVGLVVTVAQSLPKLVADGRRTLGPGVASAQVIGRFATNAGYGMVCRRLDALRRARPKQPDGPATLPGRLRGERGGDGATPSAPDATTPVRGRGDGGAGGRVGGETGSATPRQRADGARPERSGAERSGAGGRRTRSDGSNPDAGAVPAVDVLAIPGFSSLSASQVVQRLDGLTEAELRDLRAFEAGTRHRRTILNRVDQLLGR